MIYKNAFAVLLLLPSAQVASAASPDVQTPAPVIYLADNLDEADNLGWCIDTVGRGYSDKLHTHSCKPQGGDVQFAVDSDMGVIRSVAFPEECVVVLADGSDTVFGLADCDHTETAQQFSFDSASGAITPSIATDQCMAVGETSRTAGPFMSRDLVLADCGTTDPTLRTWVYRD